MKLTDKYILRQLIGPLFYCLISFIFLYVIIDLFGHLDEFLRQKVPVTTILKYYASFFPLIFVQTTPIAALVSTVGVLGNLSKHNEITAMKASGMSLWRILRPFFLMGFILSLAVLFVSERFAPSASLTSKDIKEKKIEKKTGAAQGEKVIENVAIFGANNQIIYARSFNSGSQTLKNPIVMVNDEERNLTTKIIADSAQWSNEGWKFYNCIIYKFDTANQIIEDPKIFEEKLIEMEEKPEDFLRYGIRAEFMNFVELRNYIKKIPSAGRRIINKLLVDLHYKIAFPFISLIIILVGIPFAMTSKRGGTLIGVGFSVAIALIYYGIMSICIAFGKAGVLPPIVSSWLANIIFASLGLFLISKLR